MTLSFTERVLYEQLNLEKPEKLQLNFPTEGKDLKFSLNRASLFNENFQLVAKSESGQEILNLPLPHYYYGKIEGVEESLVSLVFCQEQILGVLSFGGNNYDLRKRAISTENSSHYLLIEEKSSTSNPFEVILPSEKSLSDEGDYPQVSPQRYSHTLSQNFDSHPVTIHLECDYHTYLSNNSDLQQTTDFITGLFNAVHGIYDNIGIELTLNELVIWTEEDPYKVLGSINSAVYRDNFVCENRNGYNGRIAHLVTTARNSSNTGLRFGGRARTTECQENGLDYFQSFGISGIENEFNPDLAVFSWSIGVLAHEFGHQLSSPHTGDCRWNGDNTALDGCGFALEDPIACPGDIPEDGGTIMSSCGGLEGIETNLAKGFHPQVAEKMRGYVQIARQRQFV